MELGASAENGSIPRQYWSNSSFSNRDEESLHMQKHMPCCDVDTTCSKSAIYLKSRKGETAESKSRQSICIQQILNNFGEINKETKKTTIEKKWKFTGAPNKKCVHDWSFETGKKKYNIRT